MEFARISPSSTPIAGHRLLKTKDRARHTLALITQRALLATPDQKHWRLRRDCPCRSQRVAMANTIIVATRQKYKTPVWHIMSAFQQPCCQGSNVSKVRCIGYVGMTGPATGPH